MGRQDIELFTVFRDGATRHFDPLLVERFHQDLIGQWLGGILGGDQLLDRLADACVGDLGAVAGLVSGREKRAHFHQSMRGEHIFAGDGPRDGGRVEAEFIRDVIHGQGAEVARSQARLKGLRGVKSITLMTHFADADGPTGVAAQLERFGASIDGIPGPRSLANSAALLRFPETHADWVRPGIALYGASPFPDMSAAELGLLPAMTLTSELIAIQHLKAGEGIGYGYIYRAERDMRIGVVACGYADGYPRHAPGTNAEGAPILVGGVRTRTVGRVAMDMLYVDLTPVPSAAIGTSVTLWGEGMPADEVAAAAGTVSYELMCALAARVPVVE